MDSEVRGFIRAALGFSLKVDSPVQFCQNPSHKLGEGALLEIWRCGKARGGRISFTNL
jgi:hypothetical protein